MELHTIHQVWEWILIVSLFGLPGWIVFRPPRRIRRWPSVLRPLIATLCSEALLYTAFYSYLYPASESIIARIESDGSTIVFDGHLLLRPHDGWIPVAVISSVFLGIRCVCLAFGHLALGHRACDSSQKQPRSGHGLPII